MRLIQISDLHFTEISWSPLGLFSKRLLGNLNWLFTRQGTFSRKQLEPLGDLFRTLRADLVLLGGDFTTTSMHEEFKLAKEFVDKIGLPWIAIPGNHDQYTRKSYKKQLFYHYFSNRKADYFSLAKDRLEAHRIAPHWWLIALDTAQATNLYASNGCFPEALEGHIEAVLKQIPLEDSVLILNHYPFFQNDAPHRNLKRGEALERLMRRHPRIRLYLHGHTHRHTIANLQPNNLPLILDSGSAAQGKKGSWNLLDLEEGGCTVTAYRFLNEWQPLRTERIPWKR